jgi:hypothetical protein
MSDKPKDGFGFVVRESTDDSDDWVVDVRGPNTWYVAGFESRHAGLGWVLDYLTTVNENHARIAVEVAQDQKETDVRNSLARAALLEPVAPKKGQEN